MDDLARLRARYLIALGVPGLCVALATGCDHHETTTSIAPTAPTAIGGGPDGGRHMVMHGRWVRPDAAAPADVVPVRIGRSDPREYEAPDASQAVRGRRVAPTHGRALAEGVAPDAGRTLAPIVARDDWRDRTLALDVTSLPAEARAALAAYWSAAAATEHASVAAFARESLRLAAHGAPPGLLAGAHAAALDEVRHAQTCFALAAAFGGRAVGPGALAPGALDTGRVTLPELARTALVAGALNEAVVAQLLRESAREAHDPALRAALDAMADDEERHAEFAFRTLGWAVRAGGAPVVAALHAALAEARARVTGPARKARTPRAHDALLTAYGALSPARERATQARVLGDVVAPCVTALLGSVA